jgi:hypothetical protein
MPDFSSLPNDDNGRKKFDPGKAAIEKAAAANRAALERTEREGAPPVTFEPRCRVCTSKYRNHIESLLVKGISYSWIENNVPFDEDGGKIDRRSVSNHAKRHMAYQDAAVRAILEEEARLSAQNYEEGVRGAITHRGVLEIALRRAYEDIINGTTTVEPRDLISIVTTIQKMDEQTEQVAVNELRAQVQAFTEAIKAETGPDTWARIFDRFKRIMSDDGMSAQIGPVTDANVIE